MRSAFTVDGMCGIGPERLVNMRTTSQDQSYQSGVIRVPVNVSTEYRVWSQMFKAPSRVAKSSTGGIGDQVITMCSENLPPTAVTAGWIQIHFRHQRWT